MFTQFSEQNIEMYNRGNSIGFVTLTDGKKYRLKTLGLVEEFEKIQDLLKLNQEQSHGKDRAENHDNPNLSSSSSQATKHQHEVDNRKAEIGKSRIQATTSNKFNSKDRDK